MSDAGDVVIGPPLLSAGVGQLPVISGVDPSGQVSWFGEDAERRANERLRNSLPYVK
jgi:hypothetical protein